MTIKAPLRKVVDVIEVPVGKPIDGKQLTSFYELLECGHKQPFKQDIFGVYHATRRRCRKCLRESIEGEGTK